MSSKEPKFACPSVKLSHNPQTSSEEVLRIGRGLVKTKVYKRAALQGPSRSGAHPKLTENTDVGVAQVESSKAKRRSLILLISRRTPTEIAPADECPVASPCSAEANINTNMKDSPAEDPVGDPSGTPSPSRADSSSDLCGGPSLTPHIACTPYDITMSPLKSLAQREALTKCPKEMYEDGQVCLDALLGDSSTPAEQAESPGLQPQANNTPNYEPRVSEGGMPIAAPDLPRARPLPPIPFPATSPSTEPGWQYASKSLVSPPHDSQDAYSYVFSTSPPKPVQSQQSIAPPPPYAYRYSTTYRESNIRRDDIETHRFFNAEMPTVAPLSIVKRGKGSVAGNNNIENTGGSI